MGRLGGKTAWNKVCWSYLWQKICGSEKEIYLQLLHISTMHFKFPNTHLFPLILSTLLQSESSQLIGSLLHQVDVADRIGQGFNHIWGIEETSVFPHPAGILGFGSQYTLRETHPRMCRGRSPSLPHTRTEQVKSEPDSSHSLNWCSDNLHEERQTRDQHWGITI